MNVEAALRAVEGEVSPCGAGSRWLPVAGSGLQFDDAGERQLRASPVAGVSTDSSATSYGNNLSMREPMFWTPSGLKLELIRHLWHLKDR
jgi:hypothetical protein